MNDQFELNCYVRNIGDLRYKIVLTKLFPDMYSAEEYGNNWLYNLELKPPISQGFWKVVDTKLQ